MKGRCWKFGADINTDLIIPGRYLNTTDPVELAKHCMEDADPDFSSKVSEGDIILADKNFGCGSSREHAAVSLKGSGIAAVIAESFGRIFYRNAIAVGLPVIQAPQVSIKVEEGDILEVEVDNGKITNTRTNEMILFDPFPDFIQTFIDEGGLSNYVRKRLIKKG